MSICPCPLCQTPSELDSPAEPDVGITVDLWWCPAHGRWCLHARGCWWFLDGEFRLFRSVLS